MAEPILKVSLIKQLIAEIVNSVIENRLNIGDKLPTEREMSLLWGVSRSSIRSAIQVLAFNGIVTVKHGSGIYLNKLPNYMVDRLLPILERKEVFHDKMEARLIIESQAARLAAMRRDENDLLELRKTIDKMESILQKDSAPGYSVEDLNFHSLLVKASKNQILYSIAKNIWNNLPEWFIGYGNIQNLEIDSFHQHVEILKAIESKDAKKCELLMINHIEFATKHYEYRLFESGRKS